MVRDIDGAGTPPSEACTFAKLFVATLLVRRRTWQRRAIISGMEVVAG
jgi:hypothetical protein